MSASTAAGDAVHANGDPDARVPLHARMDIGEHVVAMAWSRDGGALALAGADGGVHLLDSAIGARTTRVGEHAAGALAVAFSRDGASVISGGQDGTLQVFARDGSQPPRRIVMEQAWVGQVACSVDGTRVAASAGRHVSIHDPRTLEVVHRFAPLAATVEALAFAPNGRQLAAASYGGLQLLTPFAPFTTRKLAWTGACLSVAWRPDASVIAAGGQDASVQFWRLPKGQQAAMSGYATKVRETAWNVSGRWLATGGGSDVVLWDFKSGPEGRPPRTLRYHSERVVGVCWQRKGPMLASIARDGTLLLWQPGRSELPVARYQLASLPTAIAWSPDDSLLALGGEDGTLAIIQPQPVLP